MGLEYWMKQKKWSEVVQSCLTLCDPMDCSPTDSSIHGIFQARILEWVAISFSRRSSWPRDRIQVSCIAGRHFPIWTTREALVNEAEVDDFLEFSCFFYNPMDVDSLISDSSAFSKSSLNIWKFSVPDLLKPHLENFENYLACEIIWLFEHSLALPFFGIGMKTDLFHSCGHCWVFQISLLT